MSKILCVLDGFGLSPKSANNVSSLANMPNFRSVLKKYRWTALNADGEAVGQEVGLVGNSEVGHMNIGGLKLVPQLSFQITKSSENTFDLDKNIAPDQLFDPKEFLKQNFEAQTKSKTVHLIGLFSKGTIHSDLRHWAGAIETAGRAGAEKIVLHIISDGRDSDRQSLVETWDYFITTFKERLAPFENKIFLGSLGGRFYSMDRDKNWERVKNGLEVIFQIRNLSYQSNYVKTFPVSEFFNESKVVQHSPDISDYDYKYVKEFYIPYFENINQNFNRFIDEMSEYAGFNRVKNQLVQITRINYAKDIFDEHIKPIAFDSTGFRDYDDKFSVLPNDTVWLLNYRTDRMKQFCKMLCDINQEFKLDLTILGMNDYGVGSEMFLGADQNTPSASQTPLLPKGEFHQVISSKEGQVELGYFPIFKNKPVVNTLAQTISKQGLTQLHIAETEKYNHVTYFLNGGQNKQWQGEDWKVIDSNKVQSHAEKPEMKAVEITDYILENGLGKYDYIVVNFANPDMLGHTGDIEASIKSMEVLDQQLGRIIEKCEKDSHKMIITADHGNVEFVGEYEMDGKKMVDTEHNPNIVPCIFVDTEFDFDKVISNLKTVKTDMGIEIDVEKIEKLLAKDNCIDLVDSELWLDINQLEELKKSAIPLWYAGVLVMALD